MHVVVLRSLMDEMERDLGAKETRRLRQLVTLSNENADNAFRELLLAHLSAELAPNERQVEALLLEFVRADAGVYGRCAASRWA